MRIAPKLGNHTQTHTHSVATQFTHHRHIKHYFRRSK